MIKNDYGHLNAPYYLEKLKTGAEIYVIPRKSDTCNVTVLVSKGSYQNNNSAVKIPFGTAFYLSNVLFDEIADSCDTVNLYRYVKVVK